MSAGLNGKASRAPRWRTGHIGWCFSGLAEFESVATLFLAQGAARHERLIYVADDPRPRTWPRHLVERGDLLIISTAEIYGAQRIVDPAAQRATYEAALSEALLKGYTGIRVVADGTSLVAGPDRLAAWLPWEDVADRLMREQPFTALCSYDRTRVDAESLRVVMGVHKVQMSPGMQCGNIS